MRSNSLAFLLMAIAYIVVLLTTSPVYGQTTNMTSLYNFSQAVLAVSYTPATGIYTITYYTETPLSQVNLTYAEANGFYVLDTLYSMNQTSVTRTYEARYGVFVLQQFNPGQLGGLRLISLLVSTLSTVQETIGATMGGVAEVLGWKVLLPVIIAVFLPVCWSLRKKRG